MPLNILLADDSVPAQSMGKKILMDAGYGVVTVSNGVEALRKIAEAVPDIAILDIFMPGYTGLEICKRLRSSADTAAIPVILTVGKLEPYRPEDGEQVQSNAVIVKPFAAVELISAVRSLIGGPQAETPTQPAEQTAPPEPAAGEVDAAPQDEPLFARGIGGEMDPIFYSGESLLSRTDSIGPSSLAFDPDAESTPFSASSLELLSPASHAEVGSGETALGELNPETASPCPAAALEASTLDEPSFPSPTAHQTAHNELAADFGLGTLGAAGHPFPSVSETAASPSELTSSLELPALDSLLEETPLASGAFESSVLQESGTPEQIFSGFDQMDAGDSSFSMEQCSADEEARRAAFEALFNSTEELPLDNVLDLKDENPPVTLVSDACAPEENAYATESHAEINALADYSGEPFAAAEFDPNPRVDAQPSEPVSEIGTPSELLPGPLDGMLARPEWPEIESEWNKEEPIALATNDLDLLQSDETNGLDVALPSLSSDAAPLEAVSVTEQACVEAHPESPIAYEPPPSAEILQIEPELAQEAAQICPEVVPPEVALPGAVALEAVATEAVVIEAQKSAPEFLHVEPNLPVADVAPAPVEAMPVKVEADVEAPVSAPEVVEPLEPTQLESEVAEISSPVAVSSRLIEAERIHHAIELVFDRFKPLLVAAIVRELARHD